MFIDEDWERLYLLDQMYYTEHEMEIEEQWQIWEEEHERKNQLPAKIEIITPKIEEYLQIKTIKNYE